MPRKQFTITIDDKTLKEYRKYCQERDINMSKRIERYMKKDIEDESNTKNKG